MADITIHLDDDTVQRAKDAALDECGKTGKSCRIIDAVCADGSGRHQN